MVDDRRLEVLRAIVTDYVSSREPVGSKALVERHRLDVSPATVRNDMAALEEEGYLTQPHTSAGRIPTDKGYRLFVDRIAQVKPLSSAERRAVSTFLRGAVDLDDVVRRTVRLLAVITHQVSIVQYPLPTSLKVRHVELVGLEPERLLVIVITSAGTVHQRVVTVPACTADELLAMRDAVNAAVVGQTIRSAASALADWNEDSRTPLGAAVVGSVLAVLATEESPRVEVGGVPNLTRFGAEFETTVKPVLEALEEQMVLLRLLGEAASDHPGDVAVRIGQENPYAPMQTTSVVASIYGPDDSTASLGVVGPTRMDYPSTMAAVRAVARYVGQFLAEG
ncbi:heat-inducible transcriptional repressor [Propionibacterium cyclohexanicum]|uniref:Heat-inducible transcription repressor HrcA n=1 Tax=Propionibacterium cyclohexanicum TaxID=64702 RepID=A0A1H9Q778_9ACTN|nr:heat-inducible transcriptional repressor HrcA [Propionibacterium cyclohexanicum]SER56331.1 heat-inducible transcriptional repressor [Propionibacterium cyclohexanicum]